ncbi:MAG TPA: DsbA family protein [Chitinophagaceae bacterium]|nr:DsbA family protein [Chitinophagaceae bacterium]
MKKKDEIPVIEPGDILIGNADAPFTLVEFVDYESEKSEKAHAVVKKIMENFKGKVNYNFRHFPMVQIHQKAHKAAEAAIAAAQEGRFFEMHETLLKNRRHLGTISLYSYAKELGIKNKSYLNDLINGKYGWNVQDDLHYGIELGVTGVPTFFINGEKFEGHVTEKSLTDFITHAMRKRKVRRAA